MALLCTPEWSRLSGRFLSLGGDKLYFWEPPLEQRTAFKSGGWSLADLDEHLEFALGADLLPQSEASSDFDCDESNQVASKSAKRLVGNISLTFQIAVDTGGTFSDVVIADDEGILAEQSSDDACEDLRGISQAIEYAAIERGITLQKLLAGSDVLIYATTRSTNAIITGNTAKTALITTRGFRDTLVFREGGKLRPFDFRHAISRALHPATTDLRGQRADLFGGRDRHTARPKRKWTRSLAELRAPTSKLSPSRCCGRS